MAKNVNEFKEAMEDFQNVLEAAATDAREVADLPTRNAIEMLIRAAGELATALRALASR